WGAPVRVILENKSGVVRPCTARAGAPLGEARSVRRSGTGFRVARVSEGGQNGACLVAESLPEADQGPSRDQFHGQGSGRRNRRDLRTCRIFYLLFISSGILYIGESVAAQPLFELLAKPT